MWLPAHAQVWERWPSDMLQLAPLPPELMWPAAAHLHHHTRVLRWLVFDDMAPLQVSVVERSWTWGCGSLCAHSHWRAVVRPQLRAVVSCWSAQVTHALEQNRCGCACVRGACVARCVWPQGLSMERLLLPAVTPAPPGAGPPAGRCGALLTVARAPSP